MSKTASAPRPATSDLERVRRIWEGQAPRFDRAMGFWERLLFAGGRQWVCAQASGEVLEIAVGTGRNLPYYRDEVRITGIDLSPAMLEIGRRRANALGRLVDLRLGDAQALEFQDRSFDTVVCTLSLCSIPDARRAVAEAKRVLQILWRLSHARAARVPPRRRLCHRGRPELEAGDRGADSRAQGGLTRAAAARLGFGGGSMRSPVRMTVFSLSGWLGTAIPAWAQDRGWDGWWSMCGNWGMWGIGMMLIMLAFWGVVIAGVVLGIRWLVIQGTGRGGEARSDGALEILRNRYARGEIDKQEFDAKTRDLA